MVLEMIEIQIYKPISDFRDYGFCIGIKDHLNLTAANIKTFFITNAFPKEKLEECYMKWDKWTSDNKILIRYER